MTKLPTSVPLSLTNHPSLHGAYHVCLHQEDAAIRFPTPPSIPPYIITARILGYLLIHAPTDIARINIANEINASQSSSEQAEAFHKIGKFYFDHFLRCFKAFNKDRTPAPSSHPSRSSFDAHKETLQIALMEAPLSRQAAKALALFRDRYRCVLTGRWDASRYEHDPQIEHQVNEDPAPGVRITPTRCAHIFPESTNHEYTDTLWAVMKRFGCAGISQELNGSNIHSLQNVMTMSMSLHDYFDRLYIWLEATDTLHHYKVCATKPGYLQELPELYVTFTTADDVKYPLPKPEYLAMHAACAKVGHMSGAGKYIDNIVEDLEDTRVLSNDGGSAELLEYALRALQLPVC